jgi:hypothetical protein
MGLGKLFVGAFVGGVAFMMFGCASDHPAAQLGTGRADCAAESGAYVGLVASDEFQQARVKDSRRR